MTELWSITSNVFDQKGLGLSWIGSFGRRRSGALRWGGSGLSAPRRASGDVFYLDNWQNSAPPPPRQPRCARLTEGAKRELCARAHGAPHARRPTAAYPRAIVVTWRGSSPVGPLSAPRGARAAAFCRYRSRGFFSDAKRHDFATSKFSGQTIAGSGEAEGEAALEFWPKSPATAHTSTGAGARLRSPTVPTGRCEGGRRSTQRDLTETLQALRTLFHSRLRHAAAGRNQDALSVVILGGGGCPAFGADSGRSRGLLLPVGQRTLTIPEAGRIQRTRRGLVSNSDAITSVLNFTHRAGERTGSRVLLGTSRREVDTPATADGERGAPASDTAAAPGRRSRRTRSRDYGAPFRSDNLVRRSPRSAATAQRAIVRQPRIHAAIGDDMTRGRRILRWRG